jgi:hypothetical protein
MDLRPIIKSADLALLGFDRGRWERRKDRATRSARQRTRGADLEHKKPGANRS